MEQTTFVDASSSRTVNNLNKRKKVIDSTNTESNVLSQAALVYFKPHGQYPLDTAVVYTLISWAIYQYAIMPWLAPVMN